MMLLNLLKNELDEGNQVFWVCPLIEESKKIDHQSSIKKILNFLNKSIFLKKVGLLHGKIDNEEKRSKY